jgi:methionyl-tRNA formyltransferase
VNPLEKKDLPEKPRVIFFGTPAFSVPTLKSLVAGGHHLLGVVTQPDRPRGRGRKAASSPVKQTAIELGLEVMQPERTSDSSFCTRIGALSPDLFVVIAFGQILKKALLEIPGWGGLNIHASLLPKYRGAAPIQRAILNNEACTGLTAMRMNEGLDTGPILYQEGLAILENETAGELHDRLSELAGRFIITVLENWAKGRISIKEQEDSLASYAPKIERNMALIDWSRSTDRIHGQILALDPWPGAATTLSGKQVKVFSSRKVQGNGRIGTPGRVVRATDAGIVVETGDGVIEIQALQLAGKKRLAAGEFLRGFSVAEGTVLGG